MGLLNAVRLTSNLCEVYLGDEETFYSGDQRDPCLA